MLLMYAYIQTKETQHSQKSSDSILDYGNALLCDLPNKTLKQLLRIQNWAVKLVLGRKKYDSSRGALKKLHWLPIEWRVNFKICCLYILQPVPTVLNGHQVELRKKSRRLTCRSDKKVLYDVPLIKCDTYGDTSCRYTGPTYWNSGKGNSGNR